VLATLIVCYLRPHDLEMMLVKHQLSDRRLYIFVDRAEKENYDRNQEVINLAKVQKGKSNIFVKVADKNLGAGNSLPTAIDWISQNEAKFIVLEDDCHLNSAGFEYLDSLSSIISAKVPIICSTSPWDLPNSHVAKHTSTFSNYPLISGWATSAESWQQVSRYLGQRAPVFKSIQSMFKYPRQAHSIGYFLAAHIRVQKGELKAWDCSVALAMLNQDLRALIPNITTVTNTGRDLVATHTRPKPGEDSIFRRETPGYPSFEVSYTEKDKNDTNHQIEKKLYGLKKRHIFSPIKAYLK
jgi:hypothetical protein